MPDFSAQRQFPRYEIQLPILHKAKIPGSIRAGVGWTRNLSEGGACVELAERIQPQMLLRVLLRTDRSGIDVEGRVVWSGGAGQAGGGILHGVAFTQVVPDQAAALRDLIRSKGEVRNAGVRLPMELTVTCQPKDQAGGPFQGTTGDISRGGLLLRLPQALPPGSKLDITLHTRGGPLTVEGAVVWVEERGSRASGPPFRHGFQFIPLGWSTLLSLGLFLAEAA
jgi:PilZ domain